MTNAILVVEDDENLRLTLSDNLEMEGYQVYSAGSLQEARNCIQTNHIDLCILDIMLPDGNGYQFSVDIRREYPQVLILMLTARILDSDLEQGFESGADDYVNKPYRLKELLLRIKALLRRKNTSIGDVEDTSSVNGFEINWAARQISCKGESIHLTKKEFDIFSHLYRNKNSVQSRDDILTSVWGDGVYVDNRTVDNFISNLKKRLKLVEGEECYIKTIRGIGYCLTKN